MKDLVLPGKARATAGGELPNDQVPAVARMVEETRYVALLHACRLGCRFKAGCDGPAGSNTYIHVRANV